MTRDHTQKDFATYVVDLMQSIGPVYSIYLSYFQAPEETLEDADVMQEWANQAYASALRTAEQKHQ